MVTSAECHSIPYCVFSFKSLIRWHRITLSNRHKEDGYYLGEWVLSQRQSRNDLTPERISRLEALPGWVWDLHEFQWDEGFSALQRFTAREGHARPPYSHKEEGYSRLGSWAGRQRQFRDTLTPGRISRLEVTDQPPGSGSLSRRLV